MDAPTSWITLLVQVPLVGVFIWYSLKLTDQIRIMQDRFLLALQQRDVEYEKRNNATCAALEKLAQALDRHDQHTDDRLTAMGAMRK